MHDAGDDEPLMEISVNPTGTAPGSDFRPPTRRPRVLRPRGELSQVARPGG